MEPYEELYRKLFNATTEAIAILQKVREETVGEFLFIPKVIENKENGGESD